MAQSWAASGDRGSRHDAQWRKLCFLLYIWATCLLLDVSVAEDQRPGLCAARLSHNVTCQKLWRSVKPYNNAMLHVTPVLSSDDCSAARCYDTLGEGHELLQQAQESPNRFGLVVNGCEVFGEVLDRSANRDVQR